MAFLWVYTHFVFVKDPENCIPDIGQLQSDVIIQIEVYHNTSALWKQRSKAVTRLIILNEIIKCNASNMSTGTGEFVCASEDVHSLYARIFFVPVRQCTISNYSRCNHVNHNIVREAVQSVNKVSKPLLHIISKSGEPWNFIHKAWFCMHASIYYVSSQVLYGNFTHEDTLTSSIPNVIISLIDNLSLLYSQKY